MTLPRKTAALEIQDSGDDVLVHDRACGKIHVLNRTAGVLLRACDGRTRVEDLAASFGEAAPEKVRNDIAAALAQFAQLGLIEA